MRDERGFTIVEFMIAAAIMAAVLGGTVMLATQLQQSYQTQLDDAALEEEARFAVDWIGQAIRNAGSNPYSIAAFTGVDINADGTSLTLEADINPPDGVLDDDNEDLTITLDADSRIITRRDNVAGTVAEDMTEPVFTELTFTLFDSDGNEVGDGNEGLAATIRVRVTGESQAYNVLLGSGTTTTLQEDFRIRTRE